MSMKRMKHLLVLCLALVMVVGLLSVTALAVDSFLSITAQGQAEPYKVGDTVKVSVTLSSEAPADGNFSITSDAGSWLKGEGLQVDNDGRSCTKIFTVMELPGKSQNVTFTVNYIDSKGEPLADDKADSIQMDFEAPTPAPVEYTLAGSLFVNGKKVTPWTDDRFSGKEGDTFTLDRFYQSALDRAEAEIDLHGATMEVCYPGGDPIDTAKVYEFGCSDFWAANKTTANVWVRLSTIHSVTFDSKGGTPVEMEEVNYGAYATAPVAPTKNGYKFVSWCAADGTAYNFNTPITSNVTLYAKWEEDTTSKPDLHYYVEADFPTWLLTDTYRDVSISIWGDRGLDWQEGATLYVAVNNSDAELWYYDSDGGFLGQGEYVDTVWEEKIPDALTFNERTITIPLSLYLDRAGTYKFTFTLVADDGKTVLATDSATVRAYTETHDDYRIYLDCGRHGSISTTPSTWADYKDTVTIYVNPDKGYELDTLRVYDKDKDRVSIYTNHRGDYTFTMPKSSVTVYATFKEVNYDHFVDVSRDSWYYDAVYYVYDHDIMDGVGSRKFAPYGDLSRAMIVTTLYRLEDEPRVRNYGTFRDVDEDAWYADAVEWAAEEGIVKGYGKKTFGPNRSVTVEQLAAILQRYADYKGYDIDETIRLYSDAVVSQWAVDNVRWAVAEDLLRGGRSVDATQVATRAEIAYALYNFMMNVAD